MWGRGRERPRSVSWWRETEIRTFTFVGGDPEEARLKETEESLSKREAEEAGMDADEGRAEATRTKKQAELAS